MTVLTGLFLVATPILTMTGTVYAQDTITEQFTIGPGNPPTIVASQGGLAEPITLQQSGGANSYFGVGNWREQPNGCTLQIQLTVTDPNTGAGTARINYNGSQANNCTLSGQQYVGAIDVGTAGATQENCNPPNVFVPAANGAPAECVQGQAPGGGFEGGGVNTQGCAGSNAPVGTDCATIPAGCPGSSIQAPGATPPATCPYQASNEAVGDPSAHDNCPIVRGTDLRWLYCPVYDGLSAVIKTIDNFINAYLSVGNGVFDDENGSYKKAWETFRGFGLGLVIVAGLVMLASEVFGLAIVDAYTVRKVLPRLLIAIIGIALSWELTQFIVGFFDDIGQAMGGIIYSSFGKTEAVDISIVLANNLILAPGVIGGAWLLLGGIGLLSLLGTLVLGMLVGAAVLVLRQAIIVAAILLAPLAIAAYILPNTSKFANFWWDTFIRMLMLYPIATGLIALCKVLGELTITGSSGVEDAVLGGLISTVVGVLFFFAGYALLPLAFRLTGGLVAQLGGIANDKSRGAFDRLKKGRQERMAGNVAAMGRGERFKGANGVSSRFNSLTKGASTFKNARYKGAFLTNKDARATAMAERDELLAQQHMKSDAGMGNMFNDDSLRAQAAGSTEKQARENLKRIYGYDDSTTEGKAKMDNAISMAKANGGFSSVRQLSATKALAATGTGYDNLSQMAQQIAVTANGNAGQIDTMVGSMRGMASKSGRYDLGAAGHSTVSNLAKESMAAGTAAPSSTSVNRALVEAGRSTANNALLQGKPKSTAHIVHALNSSLQDAHRRSNDKTLAPDVREAALAEAGELTAKITNMQGSVQFGTEVNSSAMATGRASVTGDELIPGSAGGIGFEHKDVKNTIQTVRASGSEPQRVPDLGADGKRQMNSEGEIKMRENPQYKEELQSFRNDSHAAARSGGGDPRDPRYESAAPSSDDESH